MASNHPMTLAKLTDSDLIIADRAEDVRGRHVRDPAGEELGRIADLLVDEDNGEVHFLLVERGGVLGLGATPLFVPVAAISRITDDTVHLAEPGDRTAASPGYAPEMFDGPGYHRALYAHFGPRASRG